MQTARKGFSVIEMIISISIGALLLAVVLPAIQKTREAARNEICKDNLNTIGLASIEYDEANGQLPPFLGLPFNPQNAGHAFSSLRNYQLTHSTVQLLPFIGETKLVDAVDPFAFDLSSKTIYDLGYTGSSSWMSFGTQELPGIVALVYENQVKEFTCPSAPPTLPTETKFFGMFAADNADTGVYTFMSLSGPGPPTQTNYVANAGELAITDTPINPSWIGLWGPIRSRESDGIESIPDGSSNVVTFGESLGNIAPSSQFPNARHSGIGGYGVGRADRYGIMDQTVPYFFFGTAERAHWLQFGAPHPDTVNFVLADGSVTAFNRDVEPEIFGRLCAAANVMTPSRD